MGSKIRISSHILPIILEYRKDDSQYFVEPFCGGCNLIDKVEGNRIANDTHFYLIEMWRNLIYHNYIPPLFVSEEKYLHVKNNQNLYFPHEIGYIGFNSYAGRWFKGYRKTNTNKKRCYWDEYRRKILKQVEKIKGTYFYNLDYKDLYIPPNSIIYCDPPYKSKTSYKQDFCHNEFWEWCKQKHNEGHTVFISEIDAPFECIWQKDVQNWVDKRTKNKRRSEKLYLVGNE